MPARARGLAVPAECANEEYESGGNEFRCQRMAERRTQGEGRGSDSSLTVHKSGDEAASGTGVALVNVGNMTQVKVFTATKARDREVLGEAVTAWLASNRNVRVLKTVVALSSDSAFHCLSIVLFCTRV